MELKEEETQAVSRRYSVKHSCAEREVKIPLHYINTLRKNSRRYMNALSGLKTCSIQTSVQTPAVTLLQKCDHQEQASVCTDENTSVFTAI